MERSCAVLANLDQFSPGWLKHGDNILDINYIQNEDLNINRLEQIGNTAKEFVSKNVNWQELVSLLTLNEPTIQFTRKVLVPTLGDNTSIESEKNVPNSTNRKIKSKKDLINIANDLKKKGKKIVLTSGCFDIFHIGHTRFLKQARSFGDVLIVALNTDDSTRQLKGQGRPFINQNDRAELLSELTYVDYIVFFDESTASNLISAIIPDIYVKGGDYRNKNEESWPEAKIVLDYSGKVKIVDLVSGRSSTNIINKIIDSI
ncbi:adenylyltransferase/cytidyltransferase family protein [candidate division KSB1 bacterium]|nr:adenylyltransferase/cytidyltransferase family protein [candidate division KSB1 bacterium]MBL6996449.1 adenylyltransferase/cytidyltransferase family protein [Desulfobacula sp.]